MQLVGQPCGVCSNRITAQLDIKYCADCKKVYHDACLSSDVRCPGCNKSIANDLRQIKEAAFIEHQDNLRRAFANKHALHMIIGLSIAIGGGVITYITYRAASENGGRYVIAYGAIAGGIAVFLRGIFGWISWRP